MAWRARQLAGAAESRSGAPIATSAADSEPPAHSDGPDRGEADRDWAGVQVYTIGHSTRPLAELIDLLRHYEVATLADVRTMPRSRHNPQFNLEELARALPEAGLAYAHLPRLGGLRRGLGEASPNGGWRNASFRAYADYMQTADFAAGLAELHELTSAGPVALMCAEAVPWRCHRSLIADALTIRGVEVREIRSVARTERHKLTPFARVEGLHLTYPAVDEVESEERRTIEGDRRRGDHA